MPRVKALPEAELGIARRLEEFRIGHKLSRDELSQKSKVSSDLITRIEHGRVPLLHNVAVDLLCALAPGFVSRTMDINPLYLTDQSETFAWANHPLFLPKTADVRLPPKTTFLQFVNHYRTTIEHLANPPGFAKLPTEWLGAYLEQLKSWRLDVNKASAMLTISKSIFVESARDSDVVEAITMYGRYIKEFGETRDKKKDLTTYPQEGIPADVKPIMPKLLERLRKATAERGQQAKLAETLGVSPQKVNDWLSGRVEPSGETTLRLLQWVELQERKT